MSTATLPENITLILADPLLVTSAYTVWYGDTFCVISTVTFSAKAPVPNKLASAKSIVNVVSPFASTLAQGEVLFNVCFLPLAFD